MHLTIYENIKTDSINVPLDDTIPNNDKPKQYVIIEPSKVDDIKLIFKSGMVNMLYRK